jgi:hypothetical protein
MLLRVWLALVLADRPVPRRRLRFAIYRDEAKSISKSIMGGGGPPPASSAPAKRSAVRKSCADQPALHLDCRGWAKSGARHSPPRQGRARKRSNTWVLQHTWLQITTSWRFQVLAPHRLDHSSSLRSCAVSLKTITNELASISGESSSN